MIFFLGAKQYSVRNVRAAFFAGLLSVAAVAPFFTNVSAQENGEKRAEIEAQIQELEGQAQKLDEILEGVDHEKRTLERELKEFEAEIKSREIGIRRLTLAIQKAQLDIRSKGVAIDGLSQKIETSKKGLSASLFLFYTYERDRAPFLLLSYNRLSDFFDAFNSLEKIKEYMQRNLGSARETRELVEEEKTNLETFEREQRDLRALQEIEKKLLAQKKKEKDELVRLTKGKEALFQQLLQSKKRDIASLKTELFYLEKTGITAEEALRLAELAAERTGIRPAFLLAILEVETGRQFENSVISVGTNLGTGNWKDDMYLCYIRLGKQSAAEAERRAFFKITGELGLDPDKMPVSREPSYGCGGAMGPAQFLPTTWLSFQTAVAQLTGHNPPSPWSVEDAFTAAAVFLSRAGASSKTAAGEIAAAKTYISGNPSCSRSICRYYSNRVVALAKEIDRIL